MMLLAGPTTAHDLLFDGTAADPAAGLALDFGGQLNGNLPAKIGGEARKAVARDLADAAVELTRLDLSDVLASGWQRHTELRAAGRRTRDLPGTRETVVLAQHRISHEAHPYVDVLLGDARLTRVSLTVLVTVDVTALAATVTAGRLTGLSSGRALVTGTLELAGVPLARRSRESNLPLELGFEEGLRLA